ncbi:unnamed protein product, partial [Meganyctiphanes norvegica]
MDDTGQCQHWKDGITVPMNQILGSTHTGPRLVDTKELSITVKEPECLHRKIDLEEGHFNLRQEGYLLVTNGTLRGLEMEQYCIHHQLSGSSVKVTARGCVSMPNIQRCCPLGEQMSNGNCSNKLINFIPFNPPLATGMYGDMLLAGAPFPWADRKEYVKKPSCEPGHVMKKVELDEIKAYLAVLPRMVLLTWHPENVVRQYSLPPNYCVDVPGDEGTYHAYTCQMDNKVYCEDKTCTNKCCQEGQVLSISPIIGCVPSNQPFNPPFPSLLRPLTTLYGFPTCKPITDIANFQLLEDGSLTHEEDTYTFDKFCLDTFIMEDSADLGALACITGIQLRTYDKIKRILFPVCIGFSCASLLILVILYAWIPKLREKEGKYQLFHAASLFVGFSVSLTLQILLPLDYVMDELCVFSAFVIQFSLLSSFFWLNIMCLDVWRLFRSGLYDHLSEVQGEDVVVHAVVVVGVVLQLKIMIWLQLMHPNQQLNPQLHMDVTGVVLELLQLHMYVQGVVLDLLLLNPIYIAARFEFLTRALRFDDPATRRNDPYTLPNTITRKFLFFIQFWPKTSL